MALEGGAVVRIRGTANCQSQVLLKQLGKVAFLSKWQGGVWGFLPPCKCCLCSSCAVFPALLALQLI
jgi:hypothetical protein